MSNSDTGINAVIRDIGRTPEIFKRDTAALFKMLKSTETVKKIDSHISDLKKSPMAKNQAE